MSFLIDKTATAPTQTIAYKVVMKKKWGRGYTWVPPMHASTGVRYVSGSVVRSGYRKSSYYEVCSHLGIYVILNLTAANDLLYVYGHKNHKIIEVKVSPRDWIHSPIKRGDWIEDSTATYRKVKVL